MKKILFILLIVSSTALIITSCGKKKQYNESDNVEANATGTDSTIKDAEFDDNWNEAYKAKDNLSKQTFDSLKLNTLTFLPPYEDLDFQIGKTLLNTDNKKLLTIKAIASGEISEYLLGYIGGNITDSLLVAYEDNVEYYSATYSTIENNKITVTTVNRSYDGPEEVADTIVTKYNITPELTFEEVFEEE